jgi:hypothetical protein
MATYVGAGTPGTTTAGTPAGVAVGDYVGVFAYRNAGTAPTLPAGWTLCISNNTNPASVAAFREWDGVWTMASAVFTNANRCVSFAVRAASGKEIAIGYADDTARNNSNVVWPTMALHVTDGSSVIIRGVAHTRPDSTIPTPTNHTLIDSNGTQPGYGTYRKNSSTDGNTVTVTISRSTTMTLPQVEYKDVIPVAVTQAAYQWFSEGTESGAAALASQDTKYVGNIATDDVEVGLRIRLQNAGGGAPTLATDDWQLQVAKNGGAWSNVTVGASIVYAETNVSVDSIMLPSSGANALGQSFQGNGGLLWRFGAWMHKGSQISDTVVATLYSHTGTFGSTGVPGTVLATSAPLSVSDIPSSYGWVYFTFDQTFTLTNGTPYFIGVSCTDGPVYWGFDNTASTAPGNAASRSGTTWSLDSTGDYVYQVFTGSSAPVIGYACPNTVDGGATTNRLTGGSGTFVAGKVSEDGLVDDLGWSGNNYTEVLYELVALKANLASQDILTFRVLRNGGTSDMTYEALISGYDETNAAAGGTSVSPGQRGAQSFLGDGRNLTKAGFYLKKFGAPTGNMVAELFAHTGTFGSNGVPTGTALATSAPIDMSTLSTAYGWFDFTFTPPVPLTNGTPYFIAFSNIGTGDGGNAPIFGQDSTSPTAPGNAASYFSGSWSGTPPAYEVVYRVKTEATPTLEITVGSVQREATISTLFTFTATAVVHMDVQAAISSTFTFTATAIAGPPIAQLFFGGPFANPPISAGLHRATNSAKLNGQALGWIPIGASPYRTTTGSQATLQPSSVAGPTNGIEVIQSGNPVEWISPPLDRNVTISGTISAQLWDSSSAGTNAAINVIVERLDSKMLVVSTVGRSNNTVAADVSTKRNMSFTPTSTNMLKGDRFRIRAFFDDAPTMAVGGGTMSFLVGALVEDAVGDCWIKFTELFSFQSTTPAGTVLYLTDTQSDMDAGVKAEKVMWTDRGTVSTSGTYTIPATAWAVPAQFVNVGALEWYSKPLAGFTLDGLVELNMRISGTGSLDFGVRAELDIVDQQNFLMTNWAAGSMINSTAPIGVVVAGSDNLGGNPITQTQWKSWLSGPTFVVDPQWRIRLRMYVSNQAQQQQFTGTTASLHYNGPTPGASGDAWIQLPQAISEFSTGPATREATIATTFLFTGTAAAVRTLPATIAASYTFTATATAGPLPTLGNATAAHVWNISPIQGRRPMGGLATSAHLWTISPLTSKKIMKGQATSAHLWTLAVTSKRIMKSQVTAAHLWNVAPATGTAPVLPVKQGSATASWTATLTATGKKIQKGTATTSWRAVVGYFVEDEFNGAVDTTLSSLGYLTMYGGTLYLDGSGSAYTKGGLGGNTNPNAVPNNSWMETTFRLDDTSSYSISLLFRLPTASAANGVDTGYAVTITELGIGVNRLGASKSSVAQTLVNTKDYVIRADWVGANITVTLDGTGIINWTDPAPLVGTYIGLYLDNNYGGTSDRLRYLRAGTAAVGKTPITAPGAGSATATHTWNVTPAQGKRITKTAQVTAAHLWTIAPATGKKIPVTLQVTATHLWTIAPATGVMPVLGVKQGTSVASWTATVAPATGKRITKTTSMAAAHVWTVAPSTGKKIMKALAAAAAHTWTIGPVTGKRIMKSAITAAHLWTIAPTTGRRVTYGQATATHLWNTFPASGIFPIVGVKQGTALARHDWTTSPATGKKFPQSQVTAAHTWTIAPSTGQKIMRGQATAAHTWTVSPSTGKRIMKSAITAAHLWNPVATGKRIMRAAATAAHLWNTFPSTGVMPILGLKQGTAAARHDWSTTATGKKVMSGSATAAHVWTLVVTSKRFMKGAATAAHVWNVSPSTGSKPLRGQTTAAHLWTLTAQGIRPVIGAKQGSAIASHTWTVAPITGKRIMRGPATAAAHVWTASPVTGKKIMRGVAATSTHLWVVGPATGKKIMGGSAAVTHLWSVSPSTGRRQTVGLATAVHVWRPTAEGFRFTRGTAVVFFKFKPDIARGSPGVVGVVQGIWDGYPVVAMQYGDKPIFEILMVEA